MTPAQPRPDEPAVLSPVLHLFMLLIPTVANSFLLVYALLGAVLDAQQKQLWISEAIEVASYTAGGVMAFCALLYAALRLARWPSRHPMVLANLVQIAIAAVLLLTVVLLST
ncbi:MAG: hypothetical protein OET44_19205 [Gammaproteobacteria bacterium]|nr:hypothetical protein [Gammaproteobacteria bacterium]